MRNAIIIDRGYVMFTPEQSFEDQCLEIKSKIAGVNSWLIQLRNNPNLRSTHNQNPICAKASVLLAYRHLEDACSRLDDAIRADNLTHEV